MSAAAPEVIRTKVPARLDRLPWSRFHWRIVLGLGTVWILDGLEVTIVGTVASRLTSHGSGIAITVAQVGLAGSAYVAGACLGAIFFGYLTDRFGRKRLFMITLGIYIICTAATGASFSWWYFLIFRFLTGSGIGGEYASINSAIDELIPARARGTIDLSINGSYWAGSIAGSALSLVLLDEALLPADVGWRLTFAIGMLLGLLVLLVRRNVPESPRWLFLHGHEEEAEAIVGEIERDVEESTGQPLSPVSHTLTVRPRARTPITEIVRTAFRTYPTRSLLALALFVGQAFIYNGITFDLGTLLGTFFGVAAGMVPVFTIVYGASNLAGPLTIGRLFDTVGRRPMISGTYLGSALLGALLAVLFLDKGLLGAWTFMVVLLASFFLASAGASAAYLTASEIFPMEMRALAIAVFYAVGTGLGGIIGPSLFAGFIESGSRHLVAVAFFIGAGVMALGGVAELFFGVKAERAQLEDVAAPMTAVDEENPRRRGRPTGRRGGPLGPPPRGAPPAPAGRRGARPGRRAPGERPRAPRPPPGRRRGRGAPPPARRGRAAPRRGGRPARPRRRRAGGRGRRGDQPEREQPATGAARSPPARSPVGEEAARQRAEAALERAKAHEEQAQRLSAASEADEARHRELAAAAFERARRHEQEALARAAHGDADAGTGEEPAAAGRAELHGAWARFHGELAAAHELRAEGLEEQAAAAFARAERLEEAGRAASYRVEATERHGEARAESEEEQEIEASEELAAEAARRREADERLRRRIEARRRAEATGLRRYRPGPARRESLRSFALPGPTPEEALDEQIRAVGSALAEHGPMARQELARVVGARYWGPGAFGAALRQAVADGEVRRIARSVYGPGDEDGSSPGGHERSAG